ncbi:MAG TPA: hypothetical protein VMZ29_09225 [Candidatus Bathyarchaeia archaeon]|nr:hypothetical protein [Candidatus Bathyarchaeia archaeon]
MLRELGDEDFFNAYKEYMQKRNKLIESREQELAKKQLPVFTNYNIKFIDSDLRILDLEFGMQFIVFLITKSITITREVQK